jgi:hypothetical protein
MQRNDDKLNLCQVMVKKLENENSWVLNIMGLFVNNYLRCLWLPECWLHYK